MGTLQLGTDGSKPKATKRLDLDLKSSPFAAYTNPNAPVLSVVKNSGAILDDEYINATPDSLALPLEFIIDEESLDVPEEEQESSTDVKQAQELDPREYQLELLEKAKRENIIAVLDTGSGKTLIAVLLIKEMEIIEKKEQETRRKTKITVFLVDRVPLVFQQKEVIATNCDLSVRHLCGEMVWDQWNAKMWETMINEDDVCVMTAQIFLDALRHGFVHLDRINLMIFDECHHATKNHAFNMIMREFYQRCPEEDRPKIFGMTASPMNSREEVEKSSYRLESNMNAKIFTAQNLTTLNAFLNNPMETIVEYVPYTVNGTSGLLKMLMDKFYGEPVFRQLFIAAEWTLSSLGVSCCDVLCKKWIEEFGLAAEATSENWFEDASTQNQIEERWEAAMKLVTSYPLPRPNVEDSTLFSNKIQRLIQILEICDSGSETFCGIIFVERRYTAYILQWLIQSISSFSRLKTAVLTGQQGNTAGEAKMRFKDQNKIISKFRHGEVNLLIATNVAEEGLDIQPCNVVIRFDIFSTLISYIQSRGRARQKDSKYIIMMEHNNRGQEKLLYKLRRAEEDVRAWCNALPEDRKALVNSVSEFPSNFFDEDDDDDDDGRDDFFLIPSTKAVITLNSAVGLVYQYCSTLPVDSYCSLKPEFQITNCIDGFTCSLKLPSNAAVQETFKEVASSKNLSKKLVAMKACIALYHAKGLNEHLMPVKVTQEMLGDMIPQLDNNGNVIGSRKRRKVYKKKTPWFWEKEIPKKVEEEVFDEDEAPNLVLSSQNQWLALDGSLPTNHKTITQEGINKEDGVDEVPSTANEKVAEPVTSDSKELETLSVSDVQDSIAIPEVLVYPEQFTLYMTHLKNNLNDGCDGPAQYRDVCLLTHKPLPPIPPIQLYLRHKTTETTVYTVPIEAEHIFDLKSVEKLQKYTLEIFSAISNKTFECDLKDTSYFVVPMKLEIGDDIGVNSIDWDEIDRLVEKQSSTLNLDQLDMYLDRIIVDQADSFRRYFIHQIHKELTPASKIPSDHQGREVGYKSFSDYYEKELSRVVENTEQHLIEVRRITKVLGYLSTVENMEAMPPKRTAQYVIPEFCHLYPLSASVYRTMMLLPSIMMRIDAILLINEVNAKLEINIDEILLLEAFTTPSANMDRDYERLETLGDSFLKFVATIRLFIMFPQSHEGQLHCQRIRIICNKALYRAARRLQLYKHVGSQPFNRKRWRPPHFKTKEEDEDELRIKLRRHELSDKTLADIVEATMGAAYLSGGVELGLKAAIALQVPFDHITEWSQFNETYLDIRAHLPARVKAKSVRNLKLAHLAEITSYRFQNELLVVEALTHASLPNSTVPCYQRLEFLGDGILDFLVVRYLFQKYPGYEPGRMTDMKDACVNNRILGALCLEMGLNKHIIHFSSKLVNAITQFGREVELIKDSNEDIGEYWSDLDVPKVLSDVVESIIGAIFVDSGFNFDVVQGAFGFFMRPFLDKHIQSETLKVHPLKTLTTGLQKLHCDGLLLRNHCTKREDKTSQKCVIFLHNKAIASASSHNIKEARKQAAIHAIAYLEDNLHIIPDLCDCGIQQLESDAGEEEEEEEEDGQSSIP